MYYSIVHVNKFRYSALIRQSMMEVRMQPLTDGLQRCLSFGLSVRPQVAVQAYPDPSGNIVHHFDVPGAHRSLQVTAESMVELTPGAELPDALPYSTWNDLLHCAQTHDAYEMLLPSQFAQPTELLKQFAKEIPRKRNDDPHGAYGIALLCERQRRANCQQSTQDRTNSLAATARHDAQTKPSLHDFSWLLNGTRGLCVPV